MAENRLGGPASCNAAGSYSKLTDGMVFFILTRKVDLSGEAFIFCSMDMYSFLCW